MTKLQRSNLLRDGVRSVAVVGVLAVVLGGCRGGTSVSVTPAATTSRPAPSSSSHTSSTSAAPTSSTTATAPTAAGDFTVGDCLVSSRYLKVPCTSPHEMEVTAVKPNSDTDLLQRSARREFDCMAAGAAYIAGPAYGTRFYFTFVPEAYDRRGKQQFTCIARLSQENLVATSQVTYRFKDVVRTRGFDEYKLCTVELPSRTSALPAPCNEPHAAESVWGFQYGPFEKPYPGDAAMRKNALQQCTPFVDRFVGAKRSDLTVAQNSSNAASWSKGSHLAVCYVQTDGRLVMGPLSGIGTKPLESVR